MDRRLVFGGKKEFFTENGKASENGFLARLRPTDNLSDEGIQSMWTLNIPIKMGLLEVLLCGMCIIPGLCGMVDAQEVQAIQDASKILNAPEEANDYFQHIQIVAPENVCVAVAAEGKFLESGVTPQYYALQMGKQYRFRITDIPYKPGVELFPTVEIVDRTHPPIGEELRHAVVIEMTADDLYAAISGKFVTRVIYIEDPNTAFPIASKDQKGQGYFDVAPNADPVLIAKTLGRPIAILRIGGRAPADDDFDMDFLNRCPPLLYYPPAEK